MQSMRSGSATSEVNRVDEAIHSNSGRVARVAIGGALVGLGIGRGGLIGGLLSVVGLEPLLAGIFNFSLVSVISGLFLQGDYSNQSMYHQESGSGADESVRSAY